MTGDPWTINFFIVKAFAEANNLWPSVSSSDPDEKKIGSWWEKQKYYHRQYRNGEFEKKPFLKKSGMNEERSNAIFLLLKKFPDLKPPSKWDKMYESVKRFVLRNKKLPEETIKSNAVAKKRRWFNKNRNSYIKYINGKIDCDGMNPEKAKKMKYLLEIVEDLNKDQ